MRFDFLGWLIGKPVRRQLEADVRNGGGPLLDVLKPIIIQIAQNEVQKVTGGVIPISIPGGNPQ